MKKNMGSVDRIIRAVLAVMIIILYITKQISGTATIVLAIVAVAFIFTSSVGFCPVYYPLKISTKKEKK